MRAFMASESAAVVNRSGSFNSETGSFWNMSCTESETDSIEEVLPLGPQKRQQRHQPAKPVKSASQVQALAVRHVIGFNKDSSSTPLVFGPDGLVAYLAGCFVTLYDLRTYCQVQHLTLESRKRAFSCLAISDDANLLAAGEQGQNPSVVVWQLNELPVRRPFELKGHKDTISAISFSPNGKYLATVGNTQDSQLILWDCQMETVVCSQLIHTQANLTSLSFSTDSKVLYSAGKSHFTMWSLRQKTGKGGASGSEVSLTSKSAMPSSEKLTDVVDVKAGHTGKSSFVFAITKKGQLYKLKLHKGGVSCEKKTDLRVSSAYSLAVGINKIAVACGNGLVKIIRSKNLCIEATLTKPMNDPESSSANVSPDALNCAFDERSSTLVVGYADGSVCFWDVEDTSEIRCIHMLQSSSGSIADIFSIPSAESEQKSIDRNVVKAMRSPNIHNPQAVESEFATCSDKGIINLWNLKIQSAQPRQHVLISPASERPGMWSNPRVEIHVKSISVNPPPAPKSRGTGRKTKGTLSSVKPKKESRRSLGSKSLPAVPPKPRRAPAKKPSAIPSSIPKRPAPKKKESGLKPAQRGKRVLGPGSMRLSTEFTGSAVMRAPIVAVPKAGPSKHSPVEPELSRPVPADDAHLTCIRTSPDCLHLVVGDDKGHLRIYHLASMKLVAKKALHTSPITAIEFSLPGKNGEILLATGAKDGSVSVMEVHNEFKIKLEKDDHNEPVTGLSFSPEGKAVVSCGRDNYLYYESLNPPEFDCEEDVELFLSRHFLMTSTFEAMHFNAARNTYLLACSDNFIRIFNAMGQFVHAIPIPEELGAPTKILEGPIPSMIITCHENNKLGVFEYFTGQLLAMGESHSKLTGALLINNGRNLVTTGNDGVMVIWDLPEELCRRCIACPVRWGVPQTESGYATELFLKMQREKERAASKVETDYCCHDERNSGRPLMENMASYEHSLISGVSTPVHNRPESRMSGAGLPMVSPVAQASQPMAMPKKDAVHLPSWMSKANGMGDDGFLDGFESASPSAYSRPPPPKLDLGSISDTDDESIALPVQIDRGHSLWHSRFNDLDSLPVDDFTAGPGFSRRGLNFDHDRFNHPVDSTRWGRRSKESYSGSPYGLHPCSSLARYADERSDSIYHHREDSIDRGYARPTGPEPPSSVSCASDSRTSTPFSVHPTSCFESEAMRNLHCPFGFSDEQFGLPRSPHSGNGPLGPHFRRLISRTPQSMYSDDTKTVYTRPNSEEHTKKMLGVSDESVSPMPSPFKMDVKNVYWGPALSEDEDAAFPSDTDEEEPIEFVCQTDERPDTPIARAGGRMNKNPLYSSGSEVSDVAYYKTRPMGGSVGSLLELASLAKNSFVDMAEENESDADELLADGLDDPLRNSMDAFLKVIKSTVVDSIEKLRSDVSHHKSLAECKLPTYRKHAYLDKFQREIAAFLETLQGHN